MTRFSGFSRRGVLGLLATLPFGRAIAQSGPLQLTVGSAQVPLKADAAASNVITTNTKFLPDVIRIKKGEKIDFQLKNGLNEALSMQIMGSRGTNEIEQMPGLNAKSLLPGEARSVQVTMPDAGTFLSMPVLPGNVSQQRERGLSGVIVVEESNPNPVDLDFVAVLDDARLREDGSLDPTFGQLADAARFGRLGNALMMNGKVVPQQVTVRPGSRVRLRLVSTANARIMPMKFQGGTQTVMAIDGQPCDPFDPLKRAVVMLPGSRYEIMIDVPAEAGQESLVLVDTGQLHKVLIFKAEGEPLAKRGAIQPLPLNDVPASIRLQNSARSELTITGGLERDTGKPVPSEDELKKRWPDASKIYQINNGFNSGFSSKPIITVKRGTPVVLALTNRTNWPHVLTLHGHVFRLLHPLDDGWEPYFLDTIHLPPNTVSRIAFDAVNPGKWAIHSTIAEHYDAGVATWFEVT